eukprot:6771483-Prymnesium_polylepis.2
MLQQARRIADVAPRRRTAQIGASLAHALLDPSRHTTLAENVRLHPVARARQSARDLDVRWAPI